MWGCRPGNSGDGGRWITSLRPAGQLSETLPRKRGQRPEEGHRGVEHPWLPPLLLQKKKFVFHMFHLIIALCTWMITTFQLNNKVTTQSHHGQSMWIEVCFQEGLRIASEHKQGLSPQGNATKTRMRSHLTPMKMTRIWNETTKYWWGLKTLKPLWEIVWQFLRSLKLVLVHNLAIPLLDIQPRVLDSNAGTANYYKNLGLPFPPASVSSSMGEENNNYPKILLGGLN